MTSCWLRFTQPAMAASRNWRDGVSTNRSVGCRLGEREAVAVHYRREQHRVVACVFALPSIDTLRGRQRDVPAAPVLGHRARRVRAVEVGRQPVAHHLGRADRDVGITREVAVDLEHEEHGGEQQRNPVVVGRVRLDAVDQHGEPIGDHDLLEEYAEHLLQAVRDPDRRRRAESRPVRPPHASAVSR